MSVLSALGGLSKEAAEAIAENPEVVRLLGEALLAGVSGAELVALLKGALTRASDQAMRVSLDLTSGK